jgi:hypothetical protein
MAAAQMASHPINTTSQGDSKQVGHICFVLQS